MSAGQPWNLVADIGGTNARFGIQDYASSQLMVIRRYSVADHDAFYDGVRHFLSDVAALGDWAVLPQAACLAVACPPDADDIRFTNSPWAFSPEGISTLLGGIPVTLINDFAAVGYAVTELKPKDWHQVGGRLPIPGRPIAILGPGTGLGVCTLLPLGAGYQVIEGEGGHVDFAPVDAQEAAVLEILSRRFGRVSVERLLSGNGIMNLYQALARLADKSAVYTSPSEVTAAAIAGSDSLSEKTLAMFCRVLGSVAGNLALTVGAKGGVYIAGGIVPRFLDVFERSDFRHRFDAKGRFRDYLADIPVRVILKDDLGLYGAAKKINLTEL